MARFTLAFAWAFVFAPPLDAAPSEDAASESSSGAGRLERIEALLGEADFDAAERHANELLRSGTLSHEELARVHGLIGIIASARGDETGAEQAIRRALRLEPALELPRNAGPRALSALRKARATLTEQARLHVGVALSANSAATELEVHAEITGEPDGLVASVVVEAPGFRRTLGFAKNQRKLQERVGIPPGGCRTFVAAIADEFGNRPWPDVARIDVCPAPPSAANAGAGGPAAQRGADRDASIPTQVWIAAGATAALVVATTVLGIQALDARSEYHDAIHDPGRDDRSRWTLRESAADAQHRATLFGVLAGVSGATTGLLYVFRPEAGGPSASVAPGAMLRSTWRF